MAELAHFMELMGIKQTHGKRNKLMEKKTELREECLTPRKERVPGPLANPHL